MQTREASDLHVPAEASICCSCEDGAIGERLHEAAPFPDFQRIAIRSICASPARRVQADRMSCFTADSGCQNTRTGNFLAWVPRMIVYTIKQDDDGKWSVRFFGAILVDGLQLGSAIKQARDAARVEHSRSGIPTCVEMRGAGPTVRLANYWKPERIWGNSAVY
jgi:hypothetical protein